MAGSRRVALYRVLPAMAAVAAVISMAMPGAEAAQPDPCATAPCVVVTVQPYGNGTGTVTSVTSASPGAPADGIINCHRSGYVTSGTCSHGYRIRAGESVTITLHYVQESSVSALLSVLCSDPPSSAGSIQTFTYTAAAAVSLANFGFCLAPAKTVRVTMVGAGAGSVTSYPPGIVCQTSGTTCQAEFAKYGPVTLYAAPGPSSVFVGWAHDFCTGSDPTCVIPAIGGVVSVEARFDPSTAPTAAPTASPSPSPAPATPKPTPTATMMPTPGSATVPANPATPRQTDSPGAGTSPTSVSEAATPTTPPAEADATEPTTSPVGADATADAQAAAEDVSGGGGPGPIVILAGGVLAGAGVTGGISVLRRRARPGGRPES